MEEYVFKKGKQQQTNRKHLESKKKNNSLCTQQSSTSNTNLVGTVSKLSFPSYLKNISKLQWLYSERNMIFLH